MRTPLANTSGADEPRPPQPEGGSPYETHHSVVGHHDPNPVGGKRVALAVCPADTNPRTCHYSRSWFKKLFYGDPAPNNQASARRRSAKVRLPQASACSHQTRHRLKEGF